MLDVPVLVVRQQHTNMRVVKFGRSTCHAIRGRDDQSSVSDGASCAQENGKVKLKNKEGKFDYSLLKNMAYKGQLVRPHKLKKELPVTLIPKLQTDSTEHID